MAGNDNYHPVTSDAHPVTVNKATAQVTLSNLGPHIWDGTAKAAAVTTTPSPLTVTTTYQLLDAQGEPVGSSTTTAPTAVGSYKVVATVNNPNYQGQATGTLVISAWTLKGFYSPVDYDITTTTPITRVWNTVKGGSTVPLKFEILKGSTESSNTADVEKFIATPVTCPMASSQQTRSKYFRRVARFCVTMQPPVNSSRIGRRPRSLELATT
jgi:hypothetical protein